MLTIKVTKVCAPPVRLKVPMLPALPPKNKFVLALLLVIVPGPVTVPSNVNEMPLANAVGTALVNANTPLMDGETEPTCIVLLR